MQTSSHTTRSIKPEARAAFLKGLECVTGGRKLEGARCFHQALREQPDYFDALFNLALALQELQQLNEACACYEQAVRLQPGHASAWNNLGVARRQPGQWQRAVEAHRRAVQLEPCNPDFQNNLANALRAGDRVEEAIQVLQQGLQVAPDSAVLWHALGNASREAGKLDESEAAFRRALTIDPQLVESHWDLAFTLLLKGDLSRGWEEYEWRWRRKDHPARTFAQPAWQGQDLSGKRLLVYAEQGAGDAIQFARYVPLLAQRGARVILECPRPLVALFQTLRGVEQVIARGETLPPVDLQCALLSLPRLFETTLDSIPGDVPYLSARSDGPRLPVSAQSSEPQPLRVGLVGSGNPAHVNDLRRSIPLESLRAALVNTRAIFYSLQPRKEVKADWPIDLTPLINDYADTAALIKQMDLVIAVDTSVAHLAGALGHPVWLLLPYAPDWRWLMHGNRSPWYPSMELFRQPAIGDWNSVLKLVSEKLGALTSNME